MASCLRSHHLNNFTTDYPLLPPSHRHRSRRLEPLVNRRANTTRICCQYDDTGSKPSQPSSSSSGIQVYGQIERILTETVRQSQSGWGSSADWTEIEGAWVLKPKNAKPTSVVHFIGGIFVGAAPQLAYRLFLEHLAEKGALVIATPYASGFDYFHIADEAQFKYDRVLRFLQESVRDLPTFGIGHSLGSVIHLLIGSRYAVQRSGNVLMSFNNKEASLAVPLFSPVLLPMAQSIGPILSQIASSPTVRMGAEMTLKQIESMTPPFMKQAFPLIEQLPPLYMDLVNGREEFSPKPEESRRLIKSYYGVSRNLLIKFKDDSIDETMTLAQVLSSESAISSMLDMSIRSLPGDHALPLQQAISDVPPEMANAVNRGSELFKNLTAGTPWETVAKEVLGSDNRLGVQASKDLARLEDVITSWMASNAGQFNEVLGKGATKTVYKAIDEFLGLEVAWNQVKLNEPDDLQRLYSEVHLLSTLNHPSILRFYSSWIDSHHQTFNSITEMFTSGTLREYRMKYRRVNIRAIKRWARQVLEGLVYLHSHDPPVIHRDLKCDNIFVNGHLGQVKIGDLGLAALLQDSQSAHRVIGTPEFMAPELYEEDYNELVDVYSFGMCVLEMITAEFPYTECANPAQIYKKVTSVSKALFLMRFDMLLRCLVTAKERVSARELLLDPFVALEPAQEGVESPKPFLNVKEMEKLKLSDDAAPSKTDMRITGKLNPDDTIFLKVKIFNEDGSLRNVFFPFDILHDTPLNVAMEMVKELEIDDWEPSEIAEMIDQEISALLPNRKSLECTEHETDLTVEHRDRTFRPQAAFCPILGNSKSDGQELARTATKNWMALLDSQSGDRRRAVDRRRLTRNRSLVDLHSQLLHRSLVEEVHKRRLVNTVGAVENIGFQTPREV
ncbi:Probable serine/threonine-protein kinase WNK4 [Linum grandiflorum]